MAETILYISPHLDDAVFSCTAHLAKSREEGKRTIVASLFTEGGNEERKAEDRAALEMLGAEHIWLGYLDAPYRNDYYNNFENIIFGKILDPTPNLKPLIESLKPSTIVAPLGVGNHIDHRLTFQSIEQLELNSSIWYYEDQPYANIHGATALRLNQLNYSVELPNFETFWNSFLNARYVQTHLPKEKYQAVRKRLQSIWDPTPKGKQAVRMEICRISTDPILAYKSQIKNFISLDSIPNSETFWKLVDQ